MGLMNYEKIVIFTTLYSNGKMADVTVAPISVRPLVYWLYVMNRDINR